MEMDGLDDIYKLNRFKPSKEEAVTYFLPRLLAGSPLPHGADKLIRHADVYACEPKDLAVEYEPVPTAVNTGDRFFFTTCKGKKGRFARVAGAGTWAIQKTESVYDAAGVKVGELKHLSFKKDKVSTGWVMEEYRCLLPEAVVPGGEKVLCKIHLAPNAPASARQESDAYKIRQERAEPAHALQSQPEPVTVTVTASAHLQKRPAPVAAVDLSSCKKMRMATPVPEPEEECEYEDCPVWFTPADLPAASTEVPAAAEADDDTGWLSCTLEELLGVQQQEQPLPVGAENNIEHLNFDEDIEQIAARIDWEDEDLLRPWAAADGEEAKQTVGGIVQEEQTPPIQSENSIQHLDIERYQHLVPSTDRECSEELQSLLPVHDEEEAQLPKRCNYNAAAADLNAPWLEGRNHFFSFGAVN
uniref:Uncharacterized protein n=1 Tax=Avena sativa TaxID=4498 RepID=A0ACD5V8G4_AVESA